MPVLFETSRFSHRNLVQRKKYPIDLVDNELSEITNHDWQQEIRNHNLQGSDRRPRQIHSDICQSIIYLARNRVLGGWVHRKVQPGCQWLSMEINCAVGAKNSSLMAASPALSHTVVLRKTCSTDELKKNLKFPRQIQMCCEVKDLQEQTSAERRTCTGESGESRVQSAERRTCTGESGESRVQSAERRTRTGESGECRAQSADSRERKREEKPACGVSTDALTHTGMLQSVDSQRQNKYPAQPVNGLPRAPSEIDPVKCDWAGPIGPIID
jgi:hypothetical protein